VLSIIEYSIEFNVPIDSSKGSTLINELFELEFKGFFGVSERIITLLLPF
jgi:hypothetical protein